jgi:uncharacterized membrane-anchored protein
MSNSEPHVLQPMIGPVAGYPSHAGRAAALGEIHARSRPLVATPRVLIQLAFMIEGGAVVD